MMAVAIRVVAAVVPVVLALNVLRDFMVLILGYVVFSSMKPWLLASSLQGDFRPRIPPDHLKNF